MDNQITTLIPETVGLDFEEQSVLQEFYLSVKHLAENLWFLEFQNRDRLQSAITLAQIFKSARKKISIFAGDFNGAVCGIEIYQEALKNAVVDRNVELKIVLENRPSENSPGIQLIKDINYESSKNIEIRILNDEFKFQENSVKKFNHFTFADNSKYRYEIDSTSFRAFCNFNDRDSIEKLAANFEILEYSSSAILL